MSPEIIEFLEMVFKLPLIIVFAILLTLIVYRLAKIIYISSVYLITVIRFRTGKLLPYDFNSIEPSSFGILCSKILAKQGFDSITPIDTLESGVILECKKDDNYYLVLSDIDSQPFYKRSTSDSYSLNTLTGYLLSSNVPNGIIISNMKSSDQLKAKISDSPYPIQHFNVYDLVNDNAKIG